MPKKFAGENSKAVAAKAKKSEKAEAEKLKKDKEIEDAKWADDDKSAKKKQARKEDAERKRQDALQKKQERERMLADEEVKEKTISKKVSPVKMTRAQIRDNAEYEAAKSRSAEDKGKKETLTHLETPIEENLNRVDIGSETATNLDEAIAVLSINDSTNAVDKHPEKRMKAAYEEFENIRLPQLKIENPNARLSQLKQMLRKEWMKSPDNPLNKKLAAMNSNS